MILIDAVFINGGGGYILFEYLFNEVVSDNRRQKVTFLIDYRLKEKFIDLNFNEDIKIIFIKGFFERKKYYKSNKENFSKVLCFGNVPPNIRLDAEVFTYFHQFLFIELPKNIKLFEKIKFKIKVKILKKLITNTDYWIVQGENVRNGLKKKFKISNNKIKNIPFYPPINKVSAISQIQNSYIYVSNAYPHKNHIELIEAFCEFYDLNKMGFLTLTVSAEYEEVYLLILEKIKLGYPIQNIGFIPRKNLDIEYSKNHYHIFPSLTECFPLGITESIDCGCNVIGSDKPFINQICKPTLKIESPFSRVEILRALQESIENINLEKSESKIRNNIDVLKNIIFEKYDY